MKKILAYLKEYLKDNFNLKLYLAVTVLLILSLVFNYSLDFEDSYLDPLVGRPQHWFFMFLFQSFPFLAVCFILYFTGLSKDWLKSREFWIKFVVGFGLLALDRTFFLHKYLLEGLPRVDYIFIGKVVRWCSSLVVSVVPLLIFYYLYEKDNKTVYGLAPQKWDLKPYAILLGITAVVIAAGSFLPDIQAYYPKYAKSFGDQFARSHSLDRWVAILIYELAYGSDFISVELFFRGFMVMAFSRIVGEQVVLAMVAAYCFLHFGKPLGESISSVFGGYVLGIIALKTRHIWGGILIHVGVAWLMELFASLHRIK